MGNQVLILLGSNIDPENNLPAAVKLIDLNMAIRKVSRLYETPPFGMDGDNFVNGAVIVESELQSEDIKFRVLRKIEEQLGRKRTGNKFSPRTIDLDIVIFNEVVIDPDLFELPHLMLPVSDLMPGLIDPKSGAPLQQLAEQFAMSDSIRLREDIELPGGN